MNRRWRLVQKSSVYSVSMIFCKEVHKGFYENILEYFVHAQAVCTRHLLGGEGGGGAWGRSYPKICMVEVNLSVLTEAGEQKYEWGAGVRGCKAADYPCVKHRNFLYI